MDDSVKYINSRVWNYQIKMELNFNQDISFFDYSSGDLLAETPSQPQQDIYFNFPCIENQFDYEVKSAFENLFKNVSSSTEDDSWSISMH